MADSPRSFRVEAIILRHANWGEADRLIWMYTREKGKIRGVAKGARKIRSRKAGHLEPFTRVSLQLSRGSDLPIITQAETLDAYLPIREDLLRTSYAGNIAELADKFTYEEGENPVFYRLLREVLERISSEDDPFIGVTYFKLSLLEVMGFRPQLFECVVCGKNILPVDQFLSAGLGGVVCPDCVINTSGSRSIRTDTLRYLRHLQRSTFTQVKQVHPQEGTRLEMEALLDEYMSYHLERSLRSPAFLDMIRKTHLD